jgi:hypothetical protein
MTEKNLMTFILIFLKEKKDAFWDFIYELIGMLGLYDFFFKYFY